jgi:MFS family permease
MSVSRGVLRHHNFRYLFFGQVASLTGDQVVVVAIALFVTQLTGSPTDLGIVLGAQTVPLVALVLFGGVWADRLPRHRIMIVTDLVRFALHALVAALIFAGAIRIWELAAIEAAFGAARAFFQPAYSGLIPQTVPEDEIQDAKALTEATGNVAFLAGPALATALVLGLGAGVAFVFDAATFVLSATLLTRIEPRARGEAAAPQSVMEELRGGWHEVRSRSWVWVTIAVFTGSVLTVYAPWYAIAPVIARHVYGSAGMFGVFEACGGAGAVIGGIVAFRWRPARPLATGLVLVLAWPLMAGMVALGAPVPVVIACAGATGFGFSLLMIWWETALATYIPPHALSRVSAWDWMGSLALLPLGFLVAGPLASAFGARATLGIGGVLGAAMLAAGLLPRSTRRLPGPSQDARSPVLAEPLRAKSLLAEHRAREVGEERRREPEVTHVDPLVRAVDQRRGFEHRHVPLRKEAVRDAVGECVAEPARVREPGEDHRHGLGAGLVGGDPLADRRHQRRVDG